MPVYSTDQTHKTNITDTHEGGVTETLLVDTHDRGSADYNRRRGEANDAAPDNKPAKPKAAKVQTADQTVDEVLADVDAGKVSAQAALKAERQGKNRTTLINELESRGAT